MTASQFKNGDWVAELEVSQPTLGIVRDSYELDNEALIDITVFEWDGTKIGRKSPSEGGPTTFEPACLARMYGKIEKPKFPLKRGLCGEYNFDLRWVNKV